MLLVGYATEVVASVCGDSFDLKLPGGGSLELIWVEAGEFTMGSPASEKGHDDDEIQHRVVLSKGYWLGKTEVTQYQWKSVKGSNRSSFKDSNNPVEQVSWGEAMEFCKKVTQWEQQAGRLPDGYKYSLPSEAQWEYACRAGSTGAYGGTGDLDSMGWYDKNSGNKTHPITQKQPNAWGFYDMHGNVWEWCRDWYGKYPSEGVTDPKGLATGSVSVRRGGGWRFSAEYCRSADRHYCSPDIRYDGLGFRLALVPISE